MIEVMTLSLFREVEDRGAIELLGRGPGTSTVAGALAPTVWMLAIAYGWTSNESMLGLGLS